MYSSLFIVSFLSATLLPLGSEALLLYDFSQYPTAWWALWGVATVGNTLGSVVNYVLGFKGELYLEQKGYLSKAKMDRAKGFFDRYGGVSLLFSWVPLIGDPLTFVAGVLRYRWSYFLLIVTFAKGVRYGVLLFLASNLSV